MKFLITFDEEDGDTGGSDVPQYLYNMGFKNIELYQAAYVPESYLYSKVFVDRRPNGRASNDR